MSDELTQLEVARKVLADFMFEAFRSSDQGAKKIKEAHKALDLLLAITPPGEADTKPLEPIRFRVSIGVHHAEIQVPPHAPEAYHQGMIQTAIAEVLRRTERKPLVDDADVALMDDFMSGTTHRETYGKPYLEAWSRIRQAIQPHGDADKSTIPDSTKKEGEK